MAITFDFYSSPSLPTEGKDAEKKYYARVVGGRTVDLSSLAPHIQQRCTLTKGDVIAVVNELAAELVNELCEGNHVHLPGIGYFSLSLSAPKDANPTQTHCQHIQIKKVDFRADQSLRDELLQKAKFARSEVKHHSSMLSDEEVERLLRNAFRNTPYMSRPDFSELTGLTRMTAQRQLDRLVAAGKILKKGSVHFPSYQPAPSFMEED